MPQPQPGRGELLIRIIAAGITPAELTWYPRLTFRPAKSALAQSRHMNSQELLQPWAKRLQMLKSAVKFTA